MRHGEELLIEPPHEERRPLAEVHDLVEDATRGVDVCAPTFLLDARDASEDGLAALVLEHDACRPKRLAIGGGVGYGMFPRAEDAVATRRVRAGDVGEGDGDDLVAQKRADPADGTDEGRVLGSPALAAIVGPFERGYEPFRRRAEDGLCGARGNARLGEDIVLAIAVPAHDELLRTKAHLPREALGRLGGPALGVEGDARGRATPDLVDLFGRHRDVMHEHGETARRGVALDGAVGKPRIRERGCGKPGKLGLRACERCRGHLLAADLEQEILGLCHLRPPPLPGRRRSRWQPRGGRPRNTPWPRCGRAGCSSRARWPRWRRGSPGG